MITRAVLAAVTLASLAFTSVASADVFSPDAAMERDRYFKDYWIEVTHSAALLAVSLDDWGDGNYRLDYQGIAEEYAFFAVPYGTSFTPQYVGTHDPLVANNGVAAGWAMIELPSQSSQMYLAYWDDRTWEGDATQEDGYGWLLLGRDSEGLYIDSSATALGGGIVVGTTEQLPEPAALSLAALGGLALLRRRKLQGK